jgi:hypothetical protein
MRMAMAQARDERAMGRIAAALRSVPLTTIYRAEMQSGGAYTVRRAMQTRYSGW